MGMMGIVPSGRFGRLYPNCPARLHATAMLWDRSRPHVQFRLPEPLGPRTVDSMIPRYSRPEMSAIWEPENRYRIWLEIETHAADALADLGTISRSAAEAIRAKGGFDVARIDEIEREVKHDVIAFLTSLAEHVGPEARFAHQGMTSSDVLDTCLAVQLKQASDILLKDIDELLAALKRRAFEHKFTVTIGRSHGIHAEPTTLGLKLAGHYAEFQRNRARLERARAEIATCAISGSVGTFANIDPAVEAHVAKAMGLTVEPISTQVIPRDRHAHFFATLAVIAGGIERLAIEIRHLQRTEMREAEEYFSPGQKGSSSMPHKRNPVLSENLTGLARLIRGAATPAFENVALWHERDISHSAVERVIAPDTTIALDFALARLTGLIDRLVIYPEAIRANLERLGGLVHSQRVLLALTQAGMSREDAYRSVQRNAMPVWEGKGHFAELLKHDAEVARYLTAAAIDTLFDDTYHLKHVEMIFQRVFGGT
jgi:adenylosuccinate lyase